jgi:hypothetical protein
MKIPNAPKRGSSDLSRCCAIISLFFLNIGVGLSQSDTSKAVSLLSNEIITNEESNRLCVAPTLMSYSANNAFYCTGITISPNVLSFNGSPLTSLTISPDLPTGLFFDMITGTISGTPTEDRAGNYTIILANACGSAIKVIYIAVSSGTNYYSDTDGDGFGTGTATVSCSGQPAGTATNNTDCAPNDAAKWRVSNLFFDQDEDSYNNGFPSVSICYGTDIPSGYTSSNIGTDCDDTNFKINSHAVEIPNNGKDDNCDGTIDEVTATSNLITSSCGITVPSTDTLLFAQTIPGAQAYRFEVTNGLLVSVFETTTNFFSLSNLSPRVTFSTTSTVNSVRVSYKKDGFWKSYGSACTVNTPPIPNSTSVSNPCGSFLTNIWNTIFCYNIPSASGYRFRVKNGSTLVGTFDSPVNRFSLPNVGINNLVFATGYTIDVLLKINGTWLPDSEYGATCIIYTPPTPAQSRVSIPSCGSTTNSVWTTVFAVQTSGAQGYKFVVSNGIQYREIITSVSSFSIHSIPGGPIPGTTYTIRVDVFYNNSYVEGSELCTLTVLPTAARQTNVAQDIFTVKAYPNPYSDTFKLDVNTTGEEQIGVNVYDMLGREVEALEISVSNITNLEIGLQYPSGVYNIIVRQADNVKSLRVVKR